jgi:very-short-patch-repair endonuclease
MRSGLIQLARGLRRSETSAEAVLWSELRNRQTDGWKFKRQVPFGNYILDFYCYDARLAVEVDGATHSEAKEIAQDAERAAFLKENGVRLLRYSNTEVYENLDGVLEMIYLELGQQPAPSPGARRVRADAPGRRPLPKGRGESGASGL